MALKLKGSTSGFVGLDAPAVSGNNTLILPENSGSAFQLFANDITAGVTTFTSVSVNRNGDLTVPGTISIGGTLTYEDVTSVDSVGIVTARGLSIFGNTTGLSVSGIATITKGTSGGAAANTDAALIIDNNSNNYIQLRSPNTTGQGILFGDDADNDIGSVAYNHNINSLAFTVNASERLRITSGGNVNIGGDYTASTYVLQVYGSGGSDAATIGIKNNTSGPAGIHLLSGHGNWSIFNSETIADTLEFRDESAGSTRMQIDPDGSVSLPIDNQKLKFGAGNDLNIYSTGTNGWVYTPQSTADLYLGTNAGEVYIQTGSGGNDTAIKVNSGGAVELYNNGTKQCQTFDGGLNFQDDKKAEFGASGDLKIYHSGSWNYIQSYNSKNLAIQVKDTENAIIAIPDGAVQLYHDNALRLSTWSDAVNIYGSEGADAILHLYADEGDDNADKWRILAGAAGQLDIANYSTGSWINHLSISGSGYVTKQNHPSFRSGRSSSSQSVNSGDTIIFNSTAGGSGRHNNGNHYSTTTGKFTAPVSGVYTFFTHVIYQGLSDGDSMIDAFHIYINNSQAAYSHKRSYYKNAYTGDGGYYTDTADFTGTLTAGDEIYVRHSQGTRTIHANTNYCTFSGFLVS